MLRMTADSVRPLSQGAEAGLALDFTPWFRAPASPVRRPGGAKEGENKSSRGSCSPGVQATTGRRRAQIVLPAHGGAAAAAGRETGGQLESRPRKSGAALTGGADERNSNLAPRSPPHRGPHQAAGRGARGVRGLGRDDIARGPRPALMARARAGRRPSSVLRAVGMTRGRPAPPWPWHGWPLSRSPGAAHRGGGAIAD